MLYFEAWNVFYCYCIDEVSMCLTERLNQIFEVAHSCQDSHQCNYKDQTSFDLVNEMAWHGGFHMVAAHQRLELKLETN